MHSCQNYVKTYILMFKKRKIAKRSVSWKSRVSRSSGSWNIDLRRFFTRNRNFVQFLSSEFPPAHSRFNAIFLPHFTQYNGCMHDFVRGGLWKNEKWIIPPAHSGFRALNFPPAQSGFRGVNFYRLNPGYGSLICTWSLLIPGCEAVIPAQSGLWRSDSSSCFQLN